MPSPDPFRLEAEQSVRASFSAIVGAVLLAARIAWPLLHGAMAGASWRLPVLVMLTGVLGFAVWRVLQARVYAIDDDALVVRAWWNKSVLETQPLAGLLDVADSLNRRTGTVGAAVLFRSGTPVTVPVRHLGSAGLIEALKRRAAANTRGASPA
ncbi:MAG: hypothetical protein ABJD97_21365 [Betaproteobacteria bacterium]